MRKLIVQQWVTVDNIAAEEDGGLSFVSGEPFSETTDPEFKARVVGFISTLRDQEIGGLRLHPSEAPPFHPPQHKGGVRLLEAADRT